MYLKRQLIESRYSETRISTPNDTETKSLSDYWTRSERSAVADLSEISEPDYTLNLLRQKGEPYLAITDFWKFDCQSRFIDTSGSSNKTPNPNELY